MGRDDGLAHVEIEPSVHPSLAVGKPTQVKLALLDGREQIGEFRPPWKLGNGLEKWPLRSVTLKVHDLDSEFLQTVADFFRATVSRVCQKVRDAQAARPPGGSKRCRSGRGDRQGRDRAGSGGPWCRGQFHTSLKSGLENPGP